MIRGFMLMPMGNHESGNARTREELLTDALTELGIESKVFTDEEVSSAFAVRDVIFASPATIVLWEDGSKTVVKCGRYDVYDREKGVALCFMKKLFGNSGAYNNILKAAVKDEE